MVAKIKKQVAFDLEEARRGEIYPRYVVEMGANPARVTVYTVVHIMWAGATPDVVKRRIDDSVAIVRDGMNTYIRSGQVPLEDKDGSLGTLECTVTDDRDPGLMQLFYSMNLRQSRLDKDEQEELMKALKATFRGVKIVKAR